MEEFEKIEKTKELAIFIHNTYEELSKKTGWDTQKSCKVEFDSLPEKNKKVMLGIANEILQYTEKRVLEGRIEFLKEKIVKLRRRRKYLLKIDSWKIYDEPYTLGKNANYLQELINELQTQLKELDNGKS